MRESQYGEHVKILEHFGGCVPSNGPLPRFLDIGAYDGVTFSNTRYLAELGWSGVLLEPSPMAFPHLMAYYKDNPKMQLVNAGLSTTGGLKKFYANGVGTAGDALSSFNLAHREKFSMHPFEPIWIPAITWDDLGRALPGPYDFINIDVEGMNLEILSELCKLIPYTQLSIKPEMVCVELDPVAYTEVMKRELRQAGLIHSEVIGGNLLAWK